MFGINNIKDFLETLAYIVAIVLRHPRKSEIRGKGS